MPSSPPRLLDWRRTLPGIEQDYTAKVEGGFARVYFTQRGQSGGPWFWTASRDRHIASDYADTPEEAIRLAEEALMGAPETTKPPPLPEE